MKPGTVFLNLDGLEALETRAIVIKSGQRSPTVLLKFSHNSVVTVLSPRRSPQHACFRQLTFNKIAHTRTA